MKALIFTLNLRQPLLIGQLGVGEENSAISYDYIAGSTIRGALIERYRQAAGDFDLTNLPADSLVDQLFFSGAVTYLNGYRQDKEGRRTLPAPRSWHGEKDEVDEEYGPLFDAALAPLSELSDPKTVSPHAYCPPTFAELAEEDDFTSQSETILYTPKRHVGLHNASEKRFVKQETDSVVFRYEALAAEQTFCGAILSTEGALLDRIETLLAAPDLFLGRSRSAGYGHTEIVDWQRVNNWQEYTVPTPNNQPDAITLTLLSDAIVRDRYGHYTTDLGALPAIQPLGAPTSRFVTTGLTGGFNRQWGLPLPQMPVIKAGSVWVFARNDETERALQKLAATGIGERRVEGFGRVAVNWQQFPQLQKRSSAIDPKAPEPMALTGAAKTLAEQMSKRLYRQQLERALLKALSGGLTISLAPENTQLSRLRIMARRAWREQNTTLLDTFLHKMKPLARHQYLRARVGSKSLLQWLEEGWQGDKLWSEHFYNATITLPKIGESQLDQTALAELKLEYKARLIDGLCNQVIRQRRQEAQTANAQRTEVRP